MHRGVVQQQGASSSVIYWALSPFLIPFRKNKQTKQQCRMSALSADRRLPRSTCMPSTIFSGLLGCFLCTLVNIISKVLLIMYCCFTSARRRYLLLPRPPLRFPVPRHRLVCNAMRGWRKPHWRPSSPESERIQRVAVGCRRRENCCPQRVSPNVPVWCPGTPTTFPRP